MANKGNMQKRASDCIKAFVEAGSSHYVDEDFYIRTVSDDKPVLINNSNGSEGIPVKIFHEDMIPGDFAILNPFNSQQGDMVERQWFLSAINIGMSVLVRLIMRRVLETVLSDEDTDTGYDILSLVEGNTAKIDMKMLKELDSLKPSFIGRIHYNKRNRTAKLQSDMFNEERRDQMNFRKKTWVVFEDMLKEILGTDGEDLSTLYSHTSKIMDMQETDAIFNVLTRVYRSIHSYLDKLLGHKVDVGSLLEHLNYMEEYYRACKWFIPPKVKQKETIESAPVVNYTPPVEVTQQAQPQVQMQTQAQPQIQMQPQVPVQQVPVQQAQPQMQAQVQQQVPMQQQVAPQMQGMSIEQQEIASLRASVPSTAMRPAGYPYGGQPQGMYPPQQQMGYGQPQQQMYQQQQPSYYQQQPQMHPMGNMQPQVNMVPPTSYEAQNTPSYQDKLNNIQINI